MTAAGHWVLDDGRYYVGATGNLIARVDQHLKGNEALEASRRGTALSNN